MASIAVVFGTYNRIAMLKNAVASIREAMRGIEHSYAIIIVDGGSTDGTREWLHERSNPDLWPIMQDLPLTGAVRAFNLGFARAIDSMQWPIEKRFDYIAHLNDDMILESSNAFAIAIAHMNAHPRVGAVAFGYDLYRPGTFACSYYAGKPYVNFGVIRREAGEAVARVQGDPTGRAWWNPIYKTYGADTEFGIHMWRLGWEITAMPELHVKDLNARDELRRINGGDGSVINPDSTLFFERWRDFSFEAVKPT